MDSPRELNEVTCEPRSPFPTVKDVLEVAARAYDPSEGVSEEELTLAAELVSRHSVVEIPGSADASSITLSDPIVLQQPRSLADFVSAPCKHECSLLRQSRMAKHNANVILRLGPVKQALLRATTGQYGRDSALCSRNTVEEVAKMDRPMSLAHHDSR